MARDAPGDRGIEEGGDLVGREIVVLGAEHDAIFPPREIRRTEAAYGVDAEIFPGMGHNMMLEPGWRAVAERIDGWLTAQRF